MFKVNWSNKNQHHLFLTGFCFPFFLFFFLRGLAFRVEGAGGGTGVDTVLLKVAPRLEEFDGSRSVAALLEEAALEESIPREVLREKFRNYDII